MDKKTPYRIVASGKKAERRDYSKVSGNLELPNLVEIQTDSFEWFKNDGIGRSISTRFTRFKTTEEIYV